MRHQDRVERHNPEPQLGKMDMFVRAAREKGTVLEVEVEETAARREKKGSLVYTGRRVCS